MKDLSEILRKQFEAMKKRDKIAWDEILRVAKQIDDFCKGKSK